MSFEIMYDCRHYLGDRPCRFKCTCRCEHYDPMGFRILIIKLAALGDVVRTACLLPTLKRLYPQSHITWVSKPSGVRILGGHPMIDQLVGISPEGILTVTQQEFDLVLSLDKEPAPTALCNAANCPDKRGIRMSPSGTAQPTDETVLPYFELGLDDETKFHRNQKSYPQLIHEALRLAYSREPYRLYFSRRAGERASRMFVPWRQECKGALVGLNTGAGDAFANKVPGPERWLAVAKLLQAEGFGVVLLGGPGERERNRWLSERLAGWAWDTGCDNSEQEFTAVIDQCDVVITGDTLGLHVAVARDVPVVAIFGPTCPQEIELFGLGRKLVSPCECVPCYRRHCDIEPTCMDHIPVEEIVAAVGEVRQERPAARTEI